MTIQLGPTVATVDHVQGAPVSGPISSPFGAWEQWRRDLGWTPHQGMDIACDEGTPVIAPAAGKVIECGFDPIAGNHVQVQIDGEAAIYGLFHFRDALPYRAGDHIDRGQVVGPAGMTGAATGPHVHLCLGFVVSGMALPWVDPAAYMVPAIASDVVAAPTAPPAQSVIPDGAIEALAKINVFVQTRGIAGDAWGVSVTDEGTAFAFRVRK